MKFSTTPILLTSLALSSSAAFGAPLPPVPGFNGNGNTKSTLDVGGGRSPNPDDYSDSPRMPNPNSPLLGVDLGGNINALQLNVGDGVNKIGSGDGGLGLGLGVNGGLGLGGLIGFGGKGRPNKRQLPPIPSPTNPMIPSTANIPTSVPMIAQSAQSGLTVDQVTGLAQGLDTQSQVAGQLGGVAGQAGGLVGGITAQGLNGLPIVEGLTNGLPVQGLVGTVGGLTNGLPLQGLVGTVGGLTNGLPVQGLVGGLTNGFTGTLGGLTNGSPIQGLANTVGGLTNNLPLQGLSSTVGSLANGLPLSGLTGTVGGLANGLPLQGLTGTVGSLTNNLPLQGLTGTVGSLTNGLPLQSLANGTPLQGLAGNLQSLTNSLPTQALASTAQVAANPGTLTQSVDTPMESVTSVAQGVTSSSLGNIVGNLGSNTYLLSSGQILKLASDLAPSTPLNDLHPVEIEGRMYILNSANQVVGTMTSPTIGLYSDPSFIPSEDKEEGSNPYSGGYTPLADQPDAFDLVASQMSGSEPSSTFIGSNSAGGAASVQGSLQGLNGSRMTTSQPVPTSTSALGLPTAAITDVPTGAITTNIPTAAITATPTEGWGEWVTAAPTAMPTIDNQDGAVGSAMIPQTSSGLA
ncbi:uncharacterized protein IL334_005799 [Kwoniella shivajii]|uniref:Uncharacterized protein n=1 Tax=Kwoniella shivajii TaxID=564305 RepID=A0ABZ1D5N4_9TREE|nr:hypothetical protein IL334_005799 [Kwoniella shivajii]